MRRLPRAIAKQFRAWFAKDPGLGAIAEPIASAFASFASASTATACLVATSIAATAPALDSDISNQSRWSRPRSRSGCRECLNLFSSRHTAATDTLIPNRNPNTDSKSNHRESTPAKIETLNHAARQCDRCERAKMDSAFGQGESSTA